jgi:tRNA dimethylallyltransferase
MVIAVVGPTAAGKSALSLDLARALDGEVVNADSMQLYRGMDVGTAKLTPAQRGSVPHHLLDIWPVTEPASVAEYQRLARAAVDGVLARGRTPLLVGGSGLYVRAVLEEFVFPGTDAALRTRLEEELAAVGPAAMHARLRVADPEAADRILPGNGRRIVRALEVIALTGRPFTAALPAPVPYYPVVQIGVDLDTDALDERIAARVDQMWAAGLVAETRALLDHGLARGRTASRALGYQQVLRFLAGELTEPQAHAETVRATRRFVRRQRSWFRRDPRVYWLDGQRPDLVAAALSRIRAADDLAPASSVAMGGLCGVRGDDGVVGTDMRDGAGERDEDRTVRFTKGHGTGNDFVILADPDGRLRLTPRLVAAICDRRRGIGADGVLRVVRTAKHPDAVGLAGAAEWFMDYWNADGSFAEMCGNGVRVFTRYLLDTGLAAPAPDGLPIATRAGVVRAVTGDREISVDMGLPRILDAAVATVGPLTLAGTAVDCGNPHLVCTLAADVDLAALDLSRAPGIDPEVFPAGANVEVVTAARPLPGVDRHVRMRVYERGSAETLSCGSGACAVSAVVLRDAGLDRGTVAVDVPGGRLTVTFDGVGCWLAGPAVLVARGEFDPAALTL